MDSQRQKYRGAWFSFLLDGIVCLSESSRGFCSEEVNLSATTKHAKAILHDAPLAVLTCIHISFLVVYIKVMEGSIPLETVEK